jgi:hypothetical protein
VPSHTAPLSKRTRRAVPVAAVLGAALALSAADGADATKHAGKPSPAGLSPQQLHAAYELPAVTASSSSQTMALIELGSDPTLEADLAVYDKRYGLPACSKSNGCLRVVNQTGATSPQPTSSFRSGETSIDVELAHATCENCRLLVVQADPASAGWIEAIGIAVNTAVREGATEVVICIELYAAETEAAEARYLTEANEKYFNHPGTVITVASGDCGYDETNDPEHWQFCQTTHWPYPSFPAKSPTVIAVGGTSLAEHSGEWGNTIWGQGGSGCSSTFTAPSWQQSVANWASTGCGTRRLSVDVSGDADPHTGAAIYDSTPAGDWPHAGWGTAGGTSAAAPVVAAEFALAGGAHGIAYPAQTLYSHAGDSTAFEDVSEGFNGSCGGTTLCRGAVGYDGPSGLGTPIGLSAFGLAGVPVLQRLPSISGTAARGHMLVIHPGSWGNGPASSGYQWQDCSHGEAGCLPIQGATSAAYPLTARDVNKTVRVMETVGNASGYAPPAFSSTTRVVRSVRTPARRRHTAR